LKVIGVTGGIGSGKSFICSVLEKFGFPVFYSDYEAKNIVASNKEVVFQLTELIGAELYANNQFHKEILAVRIFKDQALKEKVNQIVHPKVRNRFEEWKKSQNTSLVFIEAAILFETGMYKMCDATILVTAPESIRIERVIKRDGATIKMVLERINSQWSDHEKTKLADFIIVNDEVQPVLVQLEEVLSSLSK